MVFKQDLRNSDVDIGVTAGAAAVYFRDIYIFNPCYSFVCFYLKK